MKTSFNLINFFIASNIYVSLGVTCLTYLSMEIYGLENYFLLGFVFFATLFSYNLIRLVPFEIDIVNIMSNRHTFINDLKIYPWATVFFSGLFSIYFVLPIYKSIFLPLIISSVLSLAYGLPLMKFKSSWIRMREVPGLKIFFIALVWTIVTEGFPNLLAHKEWVILPFLERFLFVLAITIPFDIRDLKLDGEEIHTIPQFLGIKGAKSLGIICLIISELILAYRTFFAGEINLFGCLAIYLCYEVAIVLIYFSREEMSEWYISLGVEGVSILMGLLFLISQLIH